MAAKSAIALLTIWSLLLALSVSHADPFVVNAAQAPATLDPAFICDITENGYVAPLYATLLTYDRKSVPSADGIKVSAEDDTKIVGGLAKDFSVSDGGLTVTLNLRDGLLFAGGEPLDAEAVSRSLNRALKSGGCGTFYMEAGEIGNTQSIRAKDSTTVEIKLRKPAPMLPHVLTQPNLGIVNVKAVEANGGNDWLANHAAGSGPYALKSYQPGGRAELVANPNYFGPAPLEPEVTLNFVSDKSNLLVQARNGNAHVTLGLGYQYLDDIAADDALRIVSVPTSRWMLASLPNKLPPFDNPKLRQALAYATPYDPILKAVAKGYGTSFFGPFPPEFAAFRESLGQARRFDMEKAQALMKEAGIVEPVALTLTIREDQPEQEQIATILQQAWAPLGLKISVSKLSPSAYAKANSEALKKTAIIRQDGPSVNLPEWLLAYDLRCASLYNTSNYCSDEAEAHFDAVLANPDMAGRQEQWDKIARIWIDDAPRIPLYATNYVAVLSSDVTHWHFTQDGPFDVQFWGR